MIATLSERREPRVKVVARVVVSVEKLIDSARVVGVVGEHVDVRRVGSDLPLDVGDGNAVARVVEHFDTH